MKNIAIFAWGVLIGLALYHFNLREKADLKTEQHQCPYEGDPYHAIKHNIYYQNKTLLEFELKEKTDSMINQIDFSKLPSPSEVNYNER